MLPVGDCRGGDGRRASHAPVRLVPGRRGRPPRAGAIFRRSWQYVGHTGLAPAPGTFFASRCGGVPVLVTRARDGRLRAFLNVCRHRGTLLVEGEGRRATIQCPYHAWTYELDGRLRAAPRADVEGGLDLDALGLVPLALGTWGPFVFVNPDAGAAPLEETLGELPELVAAAGVDVDALVFHSRATSNVAANWKVCCENYLECYHCRVAHPGLVEVIDVAPESYGLDESRWFSTQIGPVRPDARGAFVHGEIPRGQFHFLFPNLTINIAPGRTNLSLGPVLRTGRASRFLDYFFGPDADEAWIAEYLAWDDQVGSRTRSSSASSAGSARVCSRAACSCPRASGSSRTSTGSSPRRWHRRGGRRTPPTVAPPLLSPGAGAR